MERVLVPNRREWDYAGFGPFRFDRVAYEAAVTGAALRIRSERAGAVAGEPGAG